MIGNESSVSFYSGVARAGKASRFGELFATVNQPFKPLARKARFGVTLKPTRET